MLSDGCGRAPHGRDAQTRWKLKRVCARQAHRGSSDGPSRASRLRLQSRDVCNPSSLRKVWCWVLQQDVVLCLT